MNRPKIENHYKEVGGFTYRYETQYTHKTDYERDLEAYCDALEKALDKACAMLATQSTSTDCWDFNECPFRNACNEKHNGGCNDSQKWKAWCMKDE